MTANEMEVLYAFARELISSKFVYYKMGLYLGLSDTFLEANLANTSLTPAGYEMLRYYKSKRPQLSAKQFFHRLYEAFRVCGRNPGVFRRVHRTYVSRTSNYLDSDYEDWNESARIFEDDDDDKKGGSGGGAGALSRWDEREDEVTAFFLGEHLGMHFLRHDLKREWLAEMLGYSPAEVEKMIDGLGGGSCGDDRRIITYKVFLNMVRQRGLAYLGSELRGSLYCILHDSQTMSKSRTCGTGVVTADLLKKLIDETMKADKAFCKLVDYGYVRTELQRPSPEHENGDDGEEDKVDVIKPPVKKQKTKGT